MRRPLAALAAAATFSLGGIVTAGSAAAAPSDTALGVASERSVHGCHGPGRDQHPGLHEGWSKQPGTERRNVGGTCPV